MFDIHIRCLHYERYFCGKEAKERFPEYLRQVVEAGIPVKAWLLPEIVTAFYYDCHVSPKYTPAIVLEPPGLCNDEICGEVAFSLSKQYMQPSVSFLSSAVAVLCR